MKKYLLILALPILFFGCKADPSNPKVEIVTTHGTIVVQLYDQTPLHRDNFLKLVDDNSYDSVLFHRVIDRFMIQAGDPDSKRAEAGTMLGESGIGDDIDAEFVPGLFHKKGALAAAREGDQVNPERRSSGSQFYIVQGVVYTPEDLLARVEKINENRKNAIYRQLFESRMNEIESLRRAEDMDAVEEINRQIAMACDSVFVKNKLILTPEQTEVYTTVGGTPHLDGHYTVFGEVIEGLDVIDKIASAGTDSNDRPLTDIRIIRMARKK